MRRKNALTRAGAILALAIGQVHAVTVPIDNPGFEDAVLADGEYDYSLDNQGWGYFDNAGEQGAWNPGLPGTSEPGYGGNAPEGQYVGWANPGGVGVPGGFAQVLTDPDATLKANVTYTLSVEVGNTLGYPWSGYKVQLLAGGTPHTPGTGGDYTGPVTGGTLLAEDNNTLTIAEDTFETSTVTYTYDPELHSGLLGQPLQIRLLSLGNVAAGDYTEADFDNVTLSTEATTIAKNPTPADGAADVPATTTMTWTPGQSATAHDVYLGEVFADVNEATRSDDRGVLVTQGQNATTYDPPANLEFSKTYYWRIDEVEAGGTTIHRGFVWSFTVEPLAIPVENVAATSNGISDAGVGPERTVDGSGLNENDEHSTATGDMWLAAPGTDPLSIQYEFGRVCKLHEMLVWNYNEVFELVLGFGLKDVTVEYSADGAEWTVLGDVQLAQATAEPDYTANSIVEFAGVAARFVRLSVNSGYGPMGQFGLSEVRFMQIPAHAREPQPADGATEVSADTALAWRAGRDAAVHEVYLSTNEQAVADGTALVDAVGTANFVPAGLEFANAYYWKINEVNEAEAVVSWEGDMWSFATQAFAVIDDMESYDDDENRIFDAWLDGLVNDTGSTVGYFQAPFAERTIVNSGSQSMPLEYDNTGAPFYSEAELDLGSLNLDTNGADSLRLFVSGQAPAFLETADGAILMNAIGADIWDSSDQFRYAYKLLTGNGSMTARVEALDGTPNSWAKGGVMIRQSTENGAINTFMALTGGSGGGATYQQRMTANDSSVSQHTYADGPFAPPYWVRVTREGNTLLGFTSPDGEIWTQRGDTVTLAMTDPVLIGLALTSHNAGMATGAAFANVSTSGNVTGNWQIAEVGVAQPEGNIPETVYVALEDTSGNVAVVTHPDAAITAKAGWQEWLIPYSDLAGVNLSRVATMYIGVGNRDNPTAGGTGRIFIDDVGYGGPAPE